MIRQLLTTLRPEEPWAAREHINNQTREVQVEVLSLETLTEHSPDRFDTTQRLLDDLRKSGYEGHTRPHSHTLWPDITIDRRITD